MQFVDLVKQPVRDFDELVKKHRRIGEHALGPAHVNAPTYEDDAGDYPWKTTGDPRHDHIMHAASEAYRSLERLHMDPSLLEDAPISDPYQKVFPVLQGMRSALVRLDFKTYGLSQPEWWPPTGRQAAILFVAPREATKVYLYASKVTRPLDPPYVLQWECDLSAFDAFVTRTALADAIDKVLCYSV